MRKVAILTITATILIQFFLGSVPQMFNTANAAEATLEQTFMKECLENYRTFECITLWKYGNYPAKPMIDFTDSPFETVLTHMQEPIRTSARGTPPTPTPTPKPEN